MTPELRALPEATFDRDGYPTDASLKALEHIDTTRAAIAFAEALWHSPVYVRRELTDRERAWVTGSPEHYDFWVFITDGWSGNESVIAALQANRVSLPWFMTWQLSTRGGLHILALAKAIGADQ